MYGSHNGQDFVKGRVNGVDICDEFPRQLPIKFAQIRLVCRYEFCERHMLVRMNVFFRQVCLIAVCVLSVHKITIAFLCAITQYTAIVADARRQFRY